MSQLNDRFHISGAHRWEVQKLIFYDTVTSADVRKGFASKGKKITKSSAPFSLFDRNSNSRSNAGSHTEKS